MTPTFNALLMLFCAVYNPTEISIRPSAWVGSLAAMPWLILAIFNLVIALA